MNAGGPFDLLATTTADDSTYAGIVRLVEQATAADSPFVRLADRYAVLFLVVSIGLAAAAWAVSGELARAVAVLVVATPCPLILAAPVAIVAGLSRAARRGVVVKGGGALERLADAEILLFDKTGTLTVGRPSLVEILTADEREATEVLRLAASLDQVSPHVLATAIVRAGRDRGLVLDLPSRTEEVAGSGIRGRVGEHEVAVGKAGWAGVRRRRAMGDHGSTAQRARWGRVRLRRRRRCAGRRVDSDRPDPTRRRPHDTQPPSGRHPPRRDGHR